MSAVHFTEPEGRPVKDGYVLRVPTASLNRTGDVSAAVQASWGDVELYADRLVLIDSTQRAAFIDALATHERPNHPLDREDAERMLLELNAVLLEKLRERPQRTREEREEEATRRQLSLSPPGFVCVALADDGTRVYVLRREDGSLDVTPSAVGPYKGETVTHVPPPDLPWALPHASAILTHHEHAAEAGWAAQILGDLEDWHRNASDLGRADAYLLLALYDLLSYIVEHTDYLPMIVLEAEPERGKTRTGQASAFVCRHGVHLQGIREANLLRAAGHLEAMLFIDLMNVWETAKREKCEDVILGRWERGATVPRVINPEAGAFADTVHYPVYGPTIIATNEPIHRILDTRGLRIDMPCSSRRFSGRIRPDDARPLVERLMAWRAFMLDRSLPACDVPADGRLGDILRPLNQVLLAVAPYRAHEFTAIVTWQTSRRRDELAQSWEAGIVAAVAACAHNIAAGYVAIADVLEAFNADRPETQQKSARWLGGKVRNLGWTVERVGHDNKTSLLWDDDLLDRLSVRFGLKDSSEARPADAAAHTHAMENVSHLSHMSPARDGSRDTLGDTLPDPPNVSPNVSHQVGALTRDRTAGATGATHATHLVRDADVGQAIVGCDADSPHPQPDVSANARDPWDTEEVPA